MTAFWVKDSIDKKNVNSAVILMKYFEEGMGSRRTGCFLEAILELPRGTGRQSAPGIVLVRAYTSTFQSYSKNCLSPN